MKYIKHFLLILSLFAVLACGSNESYSADGRSALACYNSKSDIYSTDIYSADIYNSYPYNIDPNSNNASYSRIAAQTYTVTFEDNGSEILEFRKDVDGGSIIPLPDIRASHCFLTEGREGKILLGWTDGSDNYTTGGRYTVNNTVTLTSVWAEGGEIYNAKEFDAIRNNLNGTYKLMRNIDLNGAEWIPIGDADNAGNLFTGKLYGNGYRIDNLTIDNNTGSAAGLFGAIGGNAEIYDLKIDLAADGISLTTPSTDKAVGALAGYIKYDGDSNIIIKNVRTSGGKITADSCSTTNKNLYAGGLVGGAIASGSSSLGGSAKITLDNLSNSTPVSVESVAVCYANLGGIIGRTDLTDATASLTSSVNYGEINLKDTSTSTGTISMYAGGLIGRGDNITVKAGANRDNVTVSTDHLIAYAGGIVGLMEKGGTIDNNSNIGNISAISGADTARSGGIAGHMEGGSSVANSHNSGRVIANSTYNWAWSGGIVGVMNGGDIDNDNNTGAVTATSTSNYAYSGGIVGQVFLSATLGATSATIDNSSNTGAVRTESKTAYSGGIAGELKANDGTVVAGIENNSNTGKVEADASDGYAYSGGIAGRVTLSSIYAAATATIDNCSNTGSDNISASVSSGTGFYASSGGIVGYMEGGGSIRNSHNSDNVTANISGGYGSAYSGGLVGYSSSSIANSYATGDVKAIATADSYAGGLVGKMHSGSSITNSYATGATGDVTANSPSTYAGGLVGDMYSGSSITNSYATGDVKAIATADSYAGGLVGRTLGSITSSVAANRKVEMTQATPYNMGRIAGLDVSGTASNSLALNTMEAIYNDTPNSSNGENGITKTDAELKDQYTYENDLGWEFGDSGDPIWKMPNGGGYPILYWQKQ